MIAIRLFVLPIFCLLLANCGGTSTDNAVAPITNPPPAPITGRFDVPSTGVAGYIGNMTVNLPHLSTREEAIGTLSLSIDFGAVSEQVSGVADGFSTANLGALSGRIFVTGGTLRAEQGNDPPGFEADLSGVLRGGALISSLVTGELVADFDTTDLSTASGTLFGDVTTSNGCLLYTSPSPRDS